MNVKVCGITDLDDALISVDCGANALGFIFVKSSPRYISPERAYQIIKSLPPFVTKVGVFADSTKNEITEVVQQTGINCLQLHGNETPEFVIELSLPVVKSFRVKPGLDISILSKYEVSAFLLDTFTENQIGGTGKTFDWDIAIEAKKFGRIILAGGINEINVKEAIAKVKPYAIDVNSGVELSPGKKDKEKMKRFFEIVQSIE